MNLLITEKGRGFYGLRKEIPWLLNGCCLLLETPVKKKVMETVNFKINKNSFLIPKKYTSSQIFDSNHTRFSLIYH